MVPQGQIFLLLMATEVQFLVFDFRFFFECFLARGTYWVKEDTGAFFWEFATSFGHHTCFSNKFSVRVFPRHPLLFFPALQR